ncbi:MAG: thioredoxin family protein [Pleurocapsa sp.]
MSFVVNENNFQREVLETSDLVLVHFWTPWCGLCRLIDPMLKTIGESQKEIIKIVSINADDNLKLANVYRLKNVPTIMLFKNGKLIEKLDNFNSRDRLKVALKKIIDQQLGHLGYLEQL